LSEMKGLSLPIQAEMLIPHGSPLRLVDRLLEVENRSGVAEASVRADGVLLGEDGSLDPVAMIELMAQSYAAVKGYDDLCKGRAVGRGFLVGIRHFSVMGRAFVGDLLRIRVKTIGMIEGFFVAEGEVLREGQTMATGTLKLWVPQDSQAEGNGV